MFKKAKVVMLPTNEKANVHKFGDCLDINAHQQKWHKEAKPEFQNIYITSDDEIKEGDWVYDPIGNRVAQIKIVSKKGENFGAKKIIATNDSSLRVTKSATGYTETRSRTFYSEEPLPQPSQSFVQKYVEQHNKGNQIVDVLVEYENDKEYWAARNQFNPNSVDFKVYTLENKEKYLGIMFDYHPVKLKISKDNTITIKKVKDSWTRDEVIKLLDKHSEMIDTCIDYEAHLSACCNVPIPNWDDNKWIEENL